MSARVYGKSRWETEAIMVSLWRGGCASLLFVWCPFSSAYEWPSIPHPPAAKVEWVAQDMTFNGVQMRTQRFTTAASSQAVLAFYRKAWAEKGGSVENDLGPWRVIGKQDGDFYLSVQTRPWGRGGAEGFLGVSRLPVLKVPPVLGHGFSRMRGSQVINDIETRDAGKRARTLLVTNSFSVESNALFYRQQLIAEGWSKIQDDTLQAGRARVIGFRRGMDQAVITINREGNQTTIVANLTQADTKTSDRGGG